MRNTLLIGVLLVFCSAISFAQGLVEQDSIFIENLNSLYQNPEKTIRLANYIFENTTSQERKAKALYILAESKMVIDNDVEGVEDLFRANDMVKNSNSPFVFSLISVSLSDRMRTLGLLDLAEDYLLRAEKAIKKIDSKREKKIAQTVILLGQAKTFNQQGDFQNSVEKLEEAEKLLNDDIPALRLIIQNELANHYIKKSEIDDAQVHTQQALSIINDSGFQRSILEGSTYRDLGHIAIINRDTVAAIQYFNQALEVFHIEKSVKLDILQSLITLYESQDSISLAQKLYNEKVQINSALQSNDRKLRSTIISHLEKEQQSNLKGDEKTYYKWGVFLTVILLIALGGYYFYNRKLDKEYQRFQEIIAQVERDEKLESPVDVEIVDVKHSKGIVIPEETEKKILERLEQFESGTKFTNSNMNLQLLAKELKTNSKYLSEIIRVHKQKNFNSYINELRINYIIHKLRTDKAYLKYKVSYLAEACGFTSHSAFTVVFKSITDITPSQFITFMEKSNKE